MAQMGLIEPGLRLPLVPLSDRSRDAVGQALAEAGIVLPLRMVEKRA
jgi:dihydrodipicolinate synthase/N-acetylneuraminate lyase